MRWSEARATTQFRDDGEISAEELGDEELEQELRTLHASRGEVFFNGTEQALVAHTDRMLTLEYEYALRFPFAAAPDPIRPRGRSRASAGQAWRLPRR